jgi:hypothetical protein
MPRFYVTLVDTKGKHLYTIFFFLIKKKTKIYLIDSFEYTPGIVKKIVNPDQTSSLRVRHDAYVKNGKVIIGYAENLSNQAKSVTVNGQVVCFFYMCNLISTNSLLIDRFRLPRCSYRQCLFFSTQIN